MSGLSKVQKRPGVGGPGDPKVSRNTPVHPPAFVARGREAGFVARGGPATHEFRFKDMFDSECLGFWGVGV